MEIDALFTATLAIMLGTYFFKSTRYYVGCIGAVWAAVNLWQVVEKESDIMVILNSIFVLALFLVMGAWGIWSKVKN